MPSTFTPDELRACFAEIEKAAAAGARCPINGQHGVDSIYTSQLAHDGKIKVEISGRNYRTVTILVGPHAGKTTAADPTGMRVWKIMDARGVYRVGPSGVPLYPPRRAGQPSTVLGAG